MSREQALTSALSRAERLYTGQQFRRVYMAGAEAALDGKPADACPYQRARGGWPFRRVWMRGFTSAKGG